MSYTGRRRKRHQHWVSPDPIKSCREKKRIPDEKEARRRAHQVGTQSGLRISYYPCFYCGGYHLTSHLHPPTPWES